MADTLLRRDAVEGRTGLNRSSIYEMMSRKEFPRPVKIGPRAVAWKSSDIDAWIASLPATHAE